MVLYKGKRHPNQQRDTFTVARLETYAPSFVVRIRSLYIYNQTPSICRRSLISFEGWLTWRQGFQLFANEDYARHEGTGLVLL